jgi:phospholipid N-methyltransferase
MHVLKECGEFFREFRQNFHTTGAILPSSRFLARALASQLRQPRPACRILEVGPGTGSVTRAIVRQMGPDDRLDCVEINERFVALLRERVKNDRAFQERRAQIEVIHAPVEQIVGESVYDYVVSGLPLNNFSVDSVREIFRSLTRLIKPGGTLSYFEYTLVRHLKTPLVGREERRRLSEVGQVLGDYIREFQVRRDHVVFNVPPAMARHLRLKPVAPAASPPPAEPVVH